MSSSTGTVRNATRNQITADYNFEKAFIFDNKFITGEYNNASGSEVTLTLGQLLGRVSATGRLVPLVATATDGSQNVVGILADTITVPDATTVTINVCTFGEVNERVLSLETGTTLDSVIAGRRLRDLIADKGIHLVPTTENTGFDN